VLVDQAPADQVQADQVPLIEQAPADEVQAAKATEETDQVSKAAAPTNPEADRPSQSPRCSIEESKNVEMTWPGQSFWN